MSRYRRNAESAIDQAVSGLSGRTGSPSPRASRSSPSCRTRTPGCGRSCSRSMSSPPGCSPGGPCRHCRDRRPALSSSPRRPARSAAVRQSSQRLRRVEGGADQLDAERRLGVGSRRGSCRTAVSPGPIDTRWCAATRRRDRGGASRDPGESDGAQAPRRGRRGRRGDRLPAESVGLVHHRRGT